jgi:hypothetical protein
MPLPLLARVYRSAIGDLGLTALTVRLVVFVFVLAPLVELGFFDRHVLEIAFVAILLFGVLYPAILIARLVSLDVLEMEERRRSDAPD